MEVFHSVKENQVCPLIVSHKVYPVAMLLLTKNLYIGNNTCRYKLKSERNTCRYKLESEWKYFIR